MTHGSLIAWNNNNNSDDNDERPQHTLAAEHRIQLPLSIVLSLKILNRNSIVSHSERASELAHANYIRQQQQQQHQRNLWILNVKYILSRAREHTLAFAHESLRRQSTLLSLFIAYSCTERCVRLLLIFICCCRCSFILLLIIKKKGKKSQQQEWRASEAHKRYGEKMMQTTY